MKQEDLLGERLKHAGVDQDYIQDTNPELIQALEQMCTSCPNPEQCRRDLETGNWEAGQANYCPNADKIDRLIVEKPR